MSDYFLLPDQPLIALQRRTRELTDAEVHYGLIPRDDWFQPDWIDENRAKAAREQMVKDNVIYGGSVP